MINKYIDDYIKNKIPVFLLQPHRKDPIPGSKGFKDWTKDEKIIRSWKTENIGIPTGDISGIFVYDTDIKTGENGSIGINGLYGFLKILKLNTLDDYIKKYPDAFIVQTGSGYQIYFRIPPGLDHNLRNTTNINGFKGLDVRGNGGYVVAPGSIHPNGNEYKIIHGSLDKIPLMPEGLYNFWHSHDHPDLLSDDFNEPRMPMNLDDKTLNLDTETTAMIFKKTPVNEGNNLLMAHAGAHALRGVSIENEKIILKEAAALNHWNGKINFATVDDSYKRVEMQKSGRIPEKEKSKTFVKGYTTLKRIIMENKENYPDYDKIMKNMEEIFESRRNLNSIEFELDDGKYIGYNCVKNYFYSAYEYEKNGEIKASHELIFNIPIKFKGLVVDDNGNKFINAIINGNDNYYTLEDFKNEMKNYAVAGSDLKKIVEFLIAYMNDKNNIKNTKYIHPDGIYIDEGNVIRTDNSYKIDLESTLETTYKIYEISTSPNNFLINFAYYLISPLSYYIRKQNKLFPYLINAGPHQTGKTSDMLLFGNLGYAQDFLKSHFTRNDLKTFYTLMKSRSESILPITLEDVDIDWIRSQATMLKGSAGTINGGSRGYFNRVIKYESKSQLTFDTNDTVDVETAQLDRFIVCNFNVDDINRINIAKFDELKGKLNPGFMFTIFDAVFGGKNLNEIIKDLYNVQNRDSLKINIINYVVSKINKIMPNNMQFKMPDFSLLHNENNETDWYAEIYNTGKYVCSQFKSDEKVHIYELNETQIDFNENSLFLTAGGYLLLQKHLNIPYKSITKLYNNTESKDFIVKFTSHRFAGEDNHPLKCLIIAPIESDDPPEIREIKEKIAQLEEIKKKLKASNIDTEGIDKTIDELNAKIESIKRSLEENKANNQEENKTDKAIKNNDENKTENTDIDNDIESLPDGPVKQSLIEERELKESKKASKINTDNNANKTITIPGNLKTYYYQVTKNFNKYDASFFIGSDIFFDSSRTILKKDSSEISYVLLKLLMPDKLNNTPKDWNKFLSDSRPLKSETEYNVLSRGDLS